MRKKDKITDQRMCWNDGVPNGIRTRVAALKGQCPRPLDDGDLRWIIYTRKT